MHSINIQWTIFYAAKIFSLLGFSLQKYIFFVHQGISSTTKFELYKTNHFERDENEIK